MATRKVTANAEELTGVLQSALEAVNAGNARAISRLFGPDVQKSVNAANKFNRTAFPDLAYKIDSVSAQGDTVTFTYTATGTHNGPLGRIKASRKQASWTGSGTAQIQDGRIVALRSAEDTLRKFIHIGFTPSLTGTWNGTSPSDPQVSVVLKLTQTGNNVTGTATAFGGTFNVTGTVDYPRIHLTGNFNGLTVNFDGQYSPPPDQITGQLTVVGVPPPITVILKRQ